MHFPHATIYYIYTYHKALPYQKAQVYSDYPIEMHYPIKNALTPIKNALPY